MVSVQMNEQAATHLAGPLVLIAVAAVYDAWAIKTRRPTISTGVRWLVKKGLGPELAGAVAGGLLFHWFLPREG